MPRRLSASRPASDWMSSSCGSPRVRVPVLSKATRSMLARRGRASGPSASTPRASNRDCARAIAAGTAKASAQGQVATSTASVAGNALLGSTSHQATATSADSTSVAVTTRRAMASAQPAMAGRCSRACATCRATCDIAVAAPTAVARRRSVPACTWLPASTASPWRRRSGVDSPVSRASSTHASSPTTVPSQGNAFPVPTCTRSPTTSSRAGTASSCSSRRRQAIAGCAPAMASSRAVLASRRRASRKRAASRNSTNITAASNHTCGPPRRVSNNEPVQASRMPPPIRVSMPGRRMRHSDHMPRRKGAPAMNTTGAETAAVTQRKASRVASGIWPAVSR